MISKVFSDLNDPMIRENWGQERCFEQLLSQRVLQKHFDTAFIFAKRLENTRSGPRRDRGGRGRGRRGGAGAGEGGVGAGVGGVRAGVGGARRGAGALPSAPRPAAEPRHREGEAGGGVSVQPGQRSPRGAG